MNNECPVCGSYQIQEHYCLHVGRWNCDGTINRCDNGEKWTTKKFREGNDLEPDSRQILIVPPKDPTWKTCMMCGTEFDEDGKIYD